MPKFGIKDESIVFFASENWWHHNPHSKNHIAKRFAKENRVLFVNSIGYGTPAFSNPDFFLRVKRKLRASLRWLNKAPEGLWVLTPITIPLYASAGVRNFNRLFVTWQVKLAMKIGRLGKPIIWVAIPFAADVVPKLDPKLMVYQVSDKYEAQEDATTTPQAIRAVDAWLKRNSALVMYSGRKLFEEAPEPHRYFLEQAVDFDHFAGDAATPAEDVAAIPHPVLGYFGGMDFVMDPDLIVEVARRKPAWHWLFIGYRSNFLRIEAPNVHFVGPKPYNDLPKYLKQIDVCVLPWRLSGAYTSYGSAIKVKEYLASGKPVVIAPLYEYLHSPGIRLYHTVDEFITQVEDALTNDTPQDIKLRQESVRSSTWDARALSVGLRLAELCRSKMNEAD